jgi:hypothetical protein
MLIYPIVTDAEVLTDLHEKLLSAGAAFQRGRLDEAADILRAFLNQVAAERGRALSDQAASAITTLTLGGASALEIPLGRGIER